MPEVIDNKLLHDTYSISFDRPFSYGIDTIEAGQNIFLVESIKKEINIFEIVMSFEGSGADEVIDFSNTFVKNAKFVSGIYHVTFCCKTADNMEFI